MAMLTNETNCDKNKFGSI